MNLLFKGLIGGVPEVAWGFSLLFSICTLACFTLAHLEHGSRRPGVIGRRSHARLYFATTILFSALLGEIKQGGGVLVAQSRVYDTNWGVEPRWILYSSHKIPVEARANMRNHGTILCVPAGRESSQQGP